MKLNRKSLRQLIESELSNQKRRIIYEESGDGSPESQKIDSFVLNYINSPVSLVLVSSKNGKYTYRDQNGSSRQAIVDFLNDRFNAGIGSEDEYGHTKINGEMKLSADAFRPYISVGANGNVMFIDPDYSPSR